MRTKQTDAERKAKQRAYYDANKDAVKARAKKAKEADRAKYNSDARARRDDRRRLYEREWSRRNPTKCAEYNAAGKRRNPARFLVNCAKDRAKKAGLPFGLVPEDVTIPEFCPVLPWIRLAFAVGRWAHSSPTIDRVIPELGYVRGNVRVISWRANMLRRDATAEELRLVAAYAASLETPLTPPARP